MFYAFFVKSMRKKILISIVLLLVGQAIIFAQRGTSLSRPIQVQESDSYISQSKENKELSLADILHAINNNQKISSLKSSKSLKTKTIIANEKVKNTSSLEILNTKRNVVNEQNNLNLEIDNEPITSMSLFKKPYSKLKATEKQFEKIMQLEEKQS